jgi:hypothetical protein
VTCDFACEFDLVRRGTCAGRRLSPQTSADGKSLCRHAERKCSSSWRLFKAYSWHPRITKMRKAGHEFGEAAVILMNPSSPPQCWSHGSVININMKALILFALIQQLPLPIRYQAYREIPVLRHGVETRIPRSFDDQPSFRSRLWLWRNSDANPLFLA